MGEKEDKFDKYDEMGQLSGGYDEDIARQKVLEHATEHLSEGEKWLQGVPLAWEVESAKFDEDENCYKVILLCYPKGIEPESKAKWEYHIDTTGKLKPGTPILHTRGKWTAESGRIQDEQQRHEDEQRRVEEEKRRKEALLKKEQEERERKQAEEERRRKEEQRKREQEEARKRAEEEKQHQKEHPLNHGQRRGKLNAKIRRKPLLISIPVLIFAVVLIMIWLTLPSTENTWHDGITFGGPGFESAQSVQQTTDGGFILAGSTTSYDEGGDCYLVKTDTQGNEEWSRTFGGLHPESAQSVQQTTDGGFILAGYIHSYNHDSYPDEIYIVKTDTQGYEEWSKTFAGLESAKAHSVQQTTDGGFILGGWTDAPGSSSSGWYCYMLKIDAQGNEEWSRSFAGSISSWAYSAQETIDGGFILAGRVVSSPGTGWDVFMVKTDAHGDKEWSKTFGGSGSDNPQSVQQTTDGGFILAGFTTSYGEGDQDCYLVKTDTQGNKEWSRTFGGSEDDKAYSVQQTSDGGFILVGSTESYGDSESDSYIYSDCYLVKTDAQGNEEWSKTFGGSEADEAYSVQQTSDGGFILVGSTESYGAGLSDILMIKTDAQGNVVPFNES